MPKSRSTLPRTHSHSHSHSSSSSKIAAVTNLQFTQKDPLPPKIPDKPKKNGLAAEYPPRTTSPYPRQTHSRIGSRGRSKEHIVPPAVPVKRAATPTAPPKVDFTISGSADDESEWVSSESGAVTPQDAVRTYPASAGTAMLPLTPANNWTATILFCGGSNRQTDQWNQNWDIASYPASPSCVRITPDFNGSYTQDDPLPEGRSMASIVILPTGKLFLLSGAGLGTAGYGITLSLCCCRTC